MINCNQPNCQKHKNCQLKTPMTPYTLEINYWLNELRKAKRNLQEYPRLLQEIQQYHRYSPPVNVYGHIKYAPKRNVFNVFIRRPEHIRYGWNLNKLEQRVNEIEDKIRNLRLKELKGE